MSCKLLLACLFCLFFQNLDAQELVMSFVEGDTTYVFGDKINARQEPNTTAGVVDQLLAGDEVIIVKATETRSNLNGVDLPWYLVRFKNKQQGYVWGGLLSVMRKAEIKDIRFVASVTKGVKPKEGPTEYTVELRAVRQNVVMQRITKNIKSDGYLYSHALEPGARGLKGYSALIQLELSVGACGYPWYTWYVLWNGNQLHGLPLCESVADGGVFAHTESYEFPQGPDENTPGHMGQADEIFFTIEHTETEEMEDGSGFNEDGWKRSRRMRWDGKQWVRPSKMGEPKTPGKN